MEKTCLCLLSGLLLKLFLFENSIASQISENSHLGDLFKSSKVLVSFLLSLNSRTEQNDIEIKGSLN